MKSKYCKETITSKKSFFAAIYDCFQYSNYFLNLTTFRFIFSKYYDNFHTIVHEKY